MSRIGLLFKKVGSTTSYGEGGKRDHVTLLHLESCYVLGANTLDDATRLKIAFGDVKESSVTKPIKGIFQKASVPLRKRIMDFKVAAGSEIPVGSELSVEHFVIGQYVDAVGTSIGKGFAGVMKRHNFAGLRASHGVSKAHRSAGSTGACQDPGRIWKGKKMAGRMGGKRVTQKNLRVLGIDVSKAMLIVKGAVPGSVGGYVLIQDAKSKGNLNVDLPFPSVVKVV